MRKNVLPKEKSTEAGEGIKMEKKSDGQHAMSVVYRLLEKSLTSIDGWKQFATNAESF